MGEDDSFWKDQFRRNAWIAPNTNNQEVEEKFVQKNPRDEPVGVPLEPLRATWSVHDGKGTAPARFQIRSRRTKSN